MFCKKYNKIAGAYLDRDIAETQRIEFEKHLLSCDPCSQTLKNINLSLEVFNSIENSQPATELSPFFPEKIAAIAAEQNSSNIPWLKRLVPVLGILVLAIGILSGYLIKSHLSSSQRDHQINLRALSYQSERLGVEIEGERFELHTRSENGKSGIDVKF